MFLCAAQIQGRFKPRCVSTSVPCSPPKAQHPHHHSGEAPFQSQELARDCFPGSLSGWWLCNGAAHMQQIRVLLTLMLIASQGDMHGEAGSSSSITLRPGVLLHRNSRDTFVRATGPVRPLLGEHEECYFTPNFVAAKHCGLGTLLPTSPLSPDTAAGATLAREQEQPSLSSLRQGRSDSPPSLQGHCQNRVFCWRRSPPCFDFLIHSGLVQCPVSPSAWVGKTSFMTGASLRGQDRILGGL